MRKHLKWLLLIAIISSVIITGNASAADIELLEAENSIFGGVLSDEEGTLYAWTLDGRVYIWQELGDSPDIVDFSETYSQNGSMQYVFTGADECMALYLNGDEYLAVPLPLSAEEVSADCNAVEIDWDDAIDAKSLYAISGAVSGDQMAIIAFDDYGYTRLLICELDDGDVDEFEFEQCSGFQLLNVCSGPNDGFIVAAADTYRENIIIYTLNAEDEIKELTKIDPGNFSAMSYSSTYDSVFYIIDNEIYSIKIEDPNVHEVISRVESIFQSETYSAAVSEDTVALAVQSSIKLYGNVQTAEEQVELVVSDSNGFEFFNQVDNEMLNANPNVSIIHTDMKYTGDLVNDLTTQSSEVDVYCYYAGYADYMAAYNRNYMLELTESDKVVESVNKMYPAIQDIVQKDGEVVSYPIDMTASLIGYNPEVFSAIGLSEDDVPKTWTEFFELLIRLPELIENTDYVGIIAKDAESLKKVILAELFSQYELWLLQNPDVQYSFDNELMRELMAMFEEIDFEGILGDIDEYYPNDAVFNMYVDFGSDFVITDTCNVMPLSFAENGEPVIKCGVYVAFINPYSENKEMALKYIEAIISNIPDTLKADIYPDWTEAVRNDEYDAILESLSRDMELLETAIEEAETDDEIEEFQNQLNEKKSVYDAINAESWIVSQEGLALYQNMAGGMIIDHDYGLDFDTIMELNYKYVDGQLSYSEMLKQIDKVIKMVLLENQ